LTNWERKRSQDPDSMRQLLAGHGAEPIRHREAASGPSSKPATASAAPARTLLRPRLRASSRTGRRPTTPSN